MPGAYGSFRGGMRHITGQERGRPPTKVRNQGSALAFALGSTHSAPLIRSGIPRIFPGEKRLRDSKRLVVSQNAVWGHYQRVGDKPSTGR